MITYQKALQLAEKWVELVSDSKCHVVKDATIDKPYGWVFFWNSKQYDPNNPSTWIAGNAPIIVDRVAGELRVTGTGRPLNVYLSEYESGLPPARLQMTPEKRS
jgi:hypothetical protein